MKRTKQCLRLAIFLIGFGCIPSSCNTDPCDAVQLADLLVSAFESSEIAGPDAEPLYRLSHSILNILDDAFECNNLTSAPENDFRQSIYYSENQNWNNSELVDNIIVRIDEIEAGEDLNLIDEINFGKDGYYLIASECDFHQEIEERDENNNINEELLSRHTINSKRVIHITHNKNRSSSISPFIKRHRTYIKK